MKRGKANNGWSTSNSVTLLSPLIFISWYSLIFNKQIKNVHTFWQIWHPLSTQESVYLNKLKNSLSTRREMKKSQNASRKELWNIFMVDITFWSAQLNWSVWQLWIWRIICCASQFSFHSMSHEWNNVITFWIQSPLRPLKLWLILDNANCAHASMPSYLFLNEIPSEESMEGSGNKISKKTPFICIVQKFTFCIHPFYHSRKPSQPTKGLGKNTK